MKPNDTELVACRLTPDFKQQVIDYAFQNDLSVSQLIRKGLRLLIQPPIKNSKSNSGWLI